MNLHKTYGRKILCQILEWQVRKLRDRQNFEIIAVVGSVGKTSTKLAIASVLGSSLKVRHQTGNYNDRLTVPLVIFGHTNPGIFDILAWLKIVWSNHQQIKSDFPYDVVVVELGTDGPGQIAEFSYLYPEISVVSAVTPEHMEFFGSLENVAEEELAVAGFSKKLIVNADDISGDYLEGLEYISYGFGVGLDYRISDLEVSGNLSQKFWVSERNGKKVELKTHLVGPQGTKVASAAFAVATEMELSQSQIVKAISSLEAFQGRMHILNGIKGSTIIDDSYNSSPAAVFAGMDVLYSIDAPQRIAVLGNMNELGKTSKKAHQEIGDYCDPKKLDAVITIGPDANTHTARHAESAGCKVSSFDSPYDAGDFLKDKIQKNAVILVKGSQNRVFAEETIKPLLKNIADEKKLVRQSDYWMNIKKQQFSKE